MLRVTNNGSESGPAHAYLVGTQVSGDCELAAMLLPDHHVTLVADPRTLRAHDLSGSLAVIAVEVDREAGSPSVVAALLREWHGRAIVIHPDLNPDDLAGLFASGADDGFALPYRRELLAERIAVLSSRGS